MSIPMIARNVMAATSRHWRDVERAIHGGDPEVARRALARHRRRLMARLPSERDPDVRAAILVSQLCGLTEQELAEVDLVQLRAEVSPRSPLWGLAGSTLHPTLIYAAAYGGGEGAAYLDEAMRTHPDPEVRGCLLNDAFWDALYERNEPRWSELFDLIVALRGECAEIQGIRHAVERTMKLAPGSPAPPLAVPDLDRDGELLTLDQFAGRFVLLDFWATWCVPCIEVMPELHQAYRDFGPRGLEILSISVDDSAEHVQRLRSDPDTPMPWHNSIIGVDEAGSALSDAYTLFAIPRTILIGPDGVIIVESPATFRDQRLLSVLEEAISTGGLLHV